MGSARLRSRSLAVLLLPLLLCAVAVLVAAVVLSSWQGSVEIRSVSEAAQAVHPGDRVDGLVACLRSSEPALDDKNRAIWLLGELRDPRALPALGALDRGEPCDHARFVCQYELRKAVDKIQGVRFGLHGPALTGSALAPHDAEHPHGTISSEILRFGY